MLEKSCVLPIPNTFFKNTCNLIFISFTAMYRLLTLLQLLAINVATSYAFQSQTFKRTRKCASSFVSFSNFQEPEWKNDDFLNSLSGSQEQRENEAQRCQEQIKKIHESKNRMEEW